MSRNTIELNFGDGEYLFALTVPRLIELQEKTGDGIGELHARMMKGVVRSSEGIALIPNYAEFRILDLIETIRQALIGGGKGIVEGQEVEVTPLVAQRLMENYVVDRNGNLRCTLYELWNTAFAILGVCVMGFDPPKKDEPAKERAKTRKKASSTTRSSASTAK